MPPDTADANASRKPADTAQPVDANTDDEQAAEAQPAAGLRSPVDYLGDLCGRHQIVLLGDQIGVRQHVLLLADALAELADNGVANFAWEFTNSRRQAELDALIDAPDWDDRACADLFVDLLGVGFGYQEYADVLHAVWQHNDAERRREADRRPIRVVALGLPTYVEDPDLLDGRSAAELELRNWSLGGHYRDISAVHAAGVLTSEVLRKGERALVYMNIAATTTRLVEWADGVPTASAGNLLWRWMGDGCRRVVFHGAVADTAATQRAEELISHSPEGRAGAELRFGLDLAASTLGSVAMTEVRGSLDGTDASLRLRDVADGYLYLGPRADWSPCALIPQLITPENFPSAEARYRALDPRPTPYTHDELEEVRRTGQLELSAAWPSLPAPPEAPKRRFARFRGHRN
ncbi:hypothetical protein [Candidatus Poriferisodalis sp.]|uniref:hypothetical protein n=1 Tax=Candidatus Poriferisodalis sp. TaxID=3101277 RepID=UPI003B011076